MKATGSERPGIRDQSRERPRFITVDLNLRRWCADRHTIELTSQVLQLLGDRERPTQRPTSARWLIIVGEGQIALGIGSCRIDRAAGKCGRRTVS